MSEHSCTARSGAAIHAGGSQRYGGRYAGSPSSDTGRADVHGARSAMRRSGTLVGGKLRNRLPSDPAPLSAARSPFHVCDRGLHRALADRDDACSIPLGTDRQPVPARRRARRTLDATGTAGPAIPPRALLELDRDQLGDSNAVEYRNSSIAGPAAESVPCRNGAMIRRLSSVRTEGRRRPSRGASRVSVGSASRSSSSTRQRNQPRREASLRAGREGLRSGA